MDPRDLPALRSGFGDPAARGHSDHEKQVLASVVCCFIEDAMRDAVDIAELRGGDVDPATVMACLKLQALPATGFLEQGDIVGRADTHFRMMSADPDAVDDAAVDEPVVRRADPERTAWLMARVDSAGEEFDAWEPEAGTTGHIIKGAILNTASKFDI